jgi:hypothetical protein
VVGADAATGVHLALALALLQLLAGGGQQDHEVLARHDVQARLMRREAWRITSVKYCAFSLVGSLVKFFQIEDGELALERQHTRRRGALRELRRRPPPISPSAATLSSGRG